MKKALLILLATAAALIVVPSPALAHHGTAGYDLTKTVTVTGTVTRYSWANPHMIVEMDTKDASGNIQHWKVELAAPLLMSRFGWSKNSIMPGDHVVAEVYPAKNGAPIGLGATANMPPKFVVNGTPLSGPRNEPSN